MKHKLALISNQFPSRVSTFISRDIRALIENNIEIDVFAFYPNNSKLWEFVPSILPPEVFSKDRVHHICFFCVRNLWSVLKTIFSRPKIVFCESRNILKSALRFGIMPFAKSIFVIIKALSWVQQVDFDHYDFIMAYWGNYAGTLAYVIHRLSIPDKPFFLFLHAGTDLYRDQVFLKEKIEYSDLVFSKWDPLL